MRTVFVHIAVACLLGILPACLWAQGSGQGGGCYAETGAQITGTVVHSNQGNDGYGVAGGDIRLFNCTVTGNKKIVKIAPVEFPGNLYCADGTVLDTAAYKEEGRDDAVGVVFWTNPDPYALWPRGYVLALKEQEQQAGMTGGSAYALPMLDTTSYGKTVAMAGSGSPAAAYCLNYSARPDNLDKGKWTAPVGRHLSALLNAYGEIRKTLDCLDGIPGHEQVMPLRDGVYGSITELQTNFFWTLRLENVLPDPKTSTTGTFTAGNLVTGVENNTVLYIFRPVLVY